MSQTRQPADNHKSANKQPPAARPELQPVAPAVSLNASVQDGRLNPASLSAGNILQLQRTIGNRKVTRLLAATIQRQPPTETRPTIPTIAVPGARMEFYEITGTTAADLRAQMNSLGPTDFAGDKSDAATFWDIRWYFGQSADGTSTVAGTTYTEDIRIVFPRWTPPAAASSQLITRWSTYIRALALHEQSHVDRALLGFRNIRTAITAATTTAAATTAGDAELQNMRQWDRAYDHATHHGATQGATFP